MFIAYTDARGRSSQRRIVCRRVDFGNGVLKAFCVERRAYREFRADRIAEACCARTGEVLDIGRLLLDLKARGLPADDARLIRAATAFTFMMRCDNESHASEEEAIERAITSFAIRFDGDDRTVEEGVALAARLAPDGDDFVGALRWIGQHQDSSRLSRYLIDHCAAVIDADGRHAAEEIHFAAKVSKYLKEIAVS